MAGGEEVNVSHYAWRPFFVTRGGDATVGGAVQADRSRSRRQQGYPYGGSQAVGSIGQAARGTALWRELGGGSALNICGYRAGGGFGSRA